MVPTSQTCLLAQSKMQKIAAPLFDATGLNFFSYARDFDGNKSISLQTDNNLYHAWFESKSPYCSHLTPDGVYASNSIQNQPLQHQAKMLNYGNGIHIFKRLKTYTEVITLAAPTNSVNMLEFYVNNIDLVNRFILFFKESAVTLIKGAMNDPILVPNDMIAKTPIIKDTIPDIQELRENFSIKKYYFDDNVEIKLSKRELECLSYYIKGLSSSQISNIMNVKKVTTDTFLRNIKMKFNSSSRSELFEKFWQLGILTANGIFS
ncbi:MAG: helix-turn-helix domain-containing protein [Proteobacteria bacterium]|nr:helix-turn-helix domain-containing protein [Pseudomonadota bacterium]